MSQLAMILAAAVALLVTSVSDAGTWRNVVTNAPGSVQLMILLPDGTVMCSDGGNGAWYKLTPDSTGNYTNGSWTTLASMNYTRRYFSSAVLRDGSILTIDTSSTATERFIPSLNQWIPDSNTPANVYGVGAELGPALLLPNGKVFFLGGNTNTLIYTPSGTTNQGSWVAGPPIPNGQACPDAPAAMLVNGKVIFACNPLGIPGTTFPTNVSFYEYDPVANSYTRQNSPTGGLTETNIAAYQTAMLCLPDGTVLYSDETSQVYIYDPNDSTLTAGAPVTNSITWGPGGSLHLT